MSAVALTSGDVVWQVKVGNEPEGAFVRPDNEVIYVNCETRHRLHARRDDGLHHYGPSGDVSIVAVQSGAVLKRIAAGSPWGVALAEAQ